MESKVKDKTNAMADIIAELKIENESIKSENEKLKNLIVKMDNCYKALKEKNERLKLDYKILETVHNINTLCHEDI